MTFRARFAFALLAGVLTLGCGTSPGDQTNHPPPPPPPPSLPPPPGTVASVSLTPGYASAQVGATVQLTAAALDAQGATMSGKTFSFITSDNAVASVSSSGVVTTKAAGVAIITASVDGRSASAAVSVPLPSNSNPIKHVFILLEENVEYPVVIGSAAMPYLNALANQYGLATQYYGNTHPSIGNYFMMTSGQVVSNDQDFMATTSIDNVVRQLVAAGKTWKVYAEDIPSAGWLGKEDGPYVRRHNPLSYYSDVANSAAQRANVVEFGQIHTDIANGTLPNYGFIVPNMCHDAHDCPTSVADAWLRNAIGPLLRSAQFQREGLLIITFDEGVSDANGGGRIAWVAIGPRAKRGFQSARLYQHESLLRFSLEVLGVTSWPGAAATAPSMMEFLTP